MLAVILPFTQVNDKSCTVGSKRLRVYIFGFLHKRGLVEIYWQFKIIFSKVVQLKKAFFFYFKSDEIFV